MEPITAAAFAIFVELCFAIIAELIIERARLIVKRVKASVRSLANN